MFKCIITVYGFDGDNRISYSWDWLQGWESVTVERYNLYKNHCIRVLKNNFQNPVITSCQLKTIDLETNQEVPLIFKE